MKKKDLKEVRLKKVEELEKVVSEKKKEQLTAYAKMKAGRENNLRKVKNLRRDIAQILGIITEKGQKSK